MYVVYLRFINVDIWFIIDVFDGEVDVYMVNENDEFIVVFNYIIGYYEVNVRGFFNFYRFVDVNGVVFLRYVLFDMELWILFCWE